MTLNADQWSVQIRDKTRRKVGLLGVQDLTGFTYTRDAWDSGAWSLRLPAGSRAAQLLAQDGAGIVVTGPGHTFTGPVSSIQWADTPSDEMGAHWEFTGEADTGILSRMLALPDETLSIEQQTTGSAVWTGTREDLMTRILNGCTAQGLDITVPQSQGRGGSATLTVDGQTALEALRTLSNSQLTFTITDMDGTLTASISSLHDMTRISLDTQTGGVSSLTVHRKPPTVTRAATRTTSSDGTTETVTWTQTDDAELAATWGVRVKLVTVDDGQTPATAAAQALAEARSQMTSASGEISQGTLPASIQPGDQVTVIGWDGDPLTVTVSSVTTGFTDGPLISATFGDWTAADSRSIYTSLLRTHAERLNRIQRRI